MFRDRISLSSFSLFFSQPHFVYPSMVFPSSFSLSSTLSVLFPLFPSLSISLSLILFSLYLPSASSHHHMFLHLFLSLVIFVALSLPPFPPPLSKYVSMRPFYLSSSASSLALPPPILIISPLQDLSRPRIFSPDMITPPAHHVLYISACLCSTINAVE